MTPAQLTRTVLAAVRRAAAARELRIESLPERITVQRPPRPGCGDYATNVALQLAGPAGRTPYEIAEVLARRLAKEPGIAQVEIAGPGFLNITLDALAYADIVRQVRTRRAGYALAYGLGDALAGQAVSMTAEPGAIRGPVVAEAVNRLLRAAGAAPGDPEPVHVAEPPAAQAAAFAALGPDAARWALLRPPAEDVPRPSRELLRQHESNPLFRIRYAHARARALLSNARDLGIDPDAGDGGTTTDVPTAHPAETDLLNLIADVPRVVETAARRRAPDRLARHLERLAEAFARFHDECPPLPKGDEKPSPAHAARLRLADAAGVVLAGGLHLLGITAPDQM